MQAASGEPLDNTRYRNYKETCEEICSLLGYMRCNAVAGQRTEAPVPDVRRKSDSIRRTDAGKCRTELELPLLRCNKPGEIL